MTTAYFEISKVSHADLQSVETRFKCFPPINKFAPFAAQATGLGGQIVAQGLPTDEWAYEYVTLETFELYRAFCPGASVPVWVRTCLESRRISDPTKYGYFTGNFVMPERSSYTIRSNLVYPFVPRLTNLVSYQLED